MSETPDLKKEDILGYECRFVVHCPSKFNRGHDLHLVKEVIHTKDGRKIPHLRKLYDYKRPFWIASKANRKYTQVKEWEDISKLKRFECTQSNLYHSIARALGNPGYNGRPRDILNNPYVYGADILSTALIKERYMKRFPELVSPFSVAAFDTEKDMINGTEQINMASISFKDRIFTAIDKSFFAGYADVENRLRFNLDKYLSEYVKKRNITWEVKLVDSDVEIITTCMAKMHEWMPDFIDIWNINFDVPLMEATLRKANIDPASVFSHPSVEDEFKFYRYREGPNKKITDSGKVMPLKPAERWHTLYTPAPSYFIDGMCVYQKIRIASGSEPSYSLDSILNKELGIRKLRFKEAEHVKKIEWHQLMQKSYPFEYVIYNVFDCISLEELDEKITDLKYSVPLFSGFSDFANFKSQPRRLVDKLHFECLAKEKVIGVTSSLLKTELDKETIPINNIIIALPVELRTNEGLRCIEENPNQRTSVYTFTADLDVSSSYPNGQAVLNISKETTRKEFVSLGEDDWEDVKMQSMNLSGGYTNALELGHHLLGLPDLETLLEAFNRSRTV